MWNLELPQSVQEARPLPQVLTGMYTLKNHLRRNSMSYHVWGLFLLLFVCSVRVLFIRSVIRYTFFQTMLEEIQQYMDKLCWIGIITWRATADTLICSLIWIAFFFRASSTSPSSQSSKMNSMLYPKQFQSASQGIRIPQHFPGQFNPQVGYGKKKFALICDDMSCMW